MAYFFPTATSLIATGTAQTGALLLSASFNVQQVGTCTSVANGVQLPSTRGGALQIITNSGAFLLSVYPQTGGMINALAVNVAITVPIGQTINLISPDGLNWFSSPYSTSTLALANPSIVAITATTTLTASQSESIINVASSAAAVTINLPAIALCIGRTFKFRVTGALTNIVTITCPDGALIKGNAYATNATAVVGPSGTASTNLLLGTGSVIGDWVNLECITATQWVASCGVTTNTTLTRS